MTDQQTTTPETDGQVLARLGTDAAKWTDEFVKHNSERTVIAEAPDPHDDAAPYVDWGTLVGWFANAIEAGRAAGRAGTP